MDLEPWQWAVAFLGAFLIGLSKTGITGLGVFAVAVFALVLPPKESVGVVLPVLMTADLVAVGVYRRNGVWSHLLRLFPWTALGVIIGFIALGYISSQQVGPLIGAILLILVGLQVWRNRTAGANQEVPHAWWFTGGVGIAAGFTTMVANASGTIMTLYLLAMALPKIEFLGTAAWFFLILNWFKVPFSWQLGLINLNSLPLDVAVAPFAIAGAVFGRQVINHIDQKLFENLMIIFTLLAALRLLFT